MAQSADTSFIPDLPKGPLCTYRKRVNFDWKRLRLIFEKEQALRIKVIFKYIILQIKSKLILFAVQGLENFRK